MSEASYAGAVVVAWLTLGYGAFVVSLVLLGFVEGLLQRRKR